MKRTLIYGTESWWAMAITRVGLFGGDGVAIGAASGNTARGSYAVAMGV